MADGPSAEDAAADLRDSDFRLTRERHKRQDASSSMTSFIVGQNIARRIRQDASVFENHPYHRQQHRSLRHNSHLLRRYPGNANVNGVNNNNGGGVIMINNNHHLPNHHQFVSKNESDCVDMICVTPFTSPINEDYEEEDDEDDDDDVDEDDDDDDDDDDNDYDDELDEEDDEIGTNRKKSASKEYRGGVRIDVTKTVKNGTSGGDNSNGNGNGSSNNNYNNTNNNNNGKSGGEGGAMTGHATAMVTATATRDDNAANCLVGDGRRLWTTVFLDADAPRVDGAGASEMNECRRAEDRNRDEHALEKVNRLGCDKRSEAGGDGAEDATQNTTDRIVSDGSSDRGSSSGDGVADAAAAVPTSGGGDAGAAGATANGLLANRHQGSPFKGQVRMAEDTLVGPCGKKRCADRYDSSESSDSGVAISCGECSSSGTSDITEPGSPCSTSSDEGVAIRGASASPLPSLPKLAPSSQVGTRPQWPWTPPLAATPCSTYKRLRGEPEAGAVPRSGAADPTFRGTIKSKPNVGHHHQESSQGKITEYFKTQIKPQQLKIKKNSEAMSVLVAKSSTEFRRPSTIQRNKAGLAKYLGTVTPNGRMNNSNNDWEVRSTLTVPSPVKRPLPVVIIPRTNGKMDKKLPKPMVSLPVSNDVLKSIPSCKITSLRLSTDPMSGIKNISTSPSTPTPALTNEVATLDFKGCILSKPHTNENNNLTNGCGSILDSLRSQASVDPLARLKVPESETEKIKERQASPTDDVEEEEEDSRSSVSKPPLSPILSAPTTIRFPAREPERQQGADSGVCRWDKCEDNFESSGELLEHLQVAHINSQTGGDNFVCQWQGCKVQGRSSCSRRWLERHVLSHGGNKPFRCIVDGCGSRFSSQPALERHVNGHFNQSENSNSSKRSCESGGKLVRRNGKRLRYRRQPWSARIFDYFDSGVMEGLQHRLHQLAKSRTQGRLAETPGNSMALTSQVLARRVELDGKTKVLLRWYPPDIEPDEWVLESEVQSTKNVGIRKAAASHPEEVSLALHPAISDDPPPVTRVKQRRKPVKNS